MHIDVTNMSQKAKFRKETSLENNKNYLRCNFSALHYLISALTTYPLHVCKEFQILFVSTLVRKIIRMSSQSINI